MLSQRGMLRAIKVWSSFGFARGAGGGALAL
jgi:hypothetical protein